MKVENMQNFKCACGKKKQKEKKQQIQTNVS